MWGESAFGARETDEGIDFVRLRFDEEILFLGLMALEAEGLGGFVLGYPSVLLNFNVATKPWVSWASWSLTPFSASGESFT